MPVFNFDKTNFTEDPGGKVAFFAKGTKYAEMVCNSSKSSVSVLFCGSAAGAVLPPFVVYQAVNCWSKWCENGPPGARYSATPSGWFNFFTVLEWLEKIFIPARQKLDGKVVLVCDNLSSHLNVDFIKVCQDNNVELVCLPPNVTDKMQPLDVAVFGPMKRRWREMLHKMRIQEPTLKALDKVPFPSHLKRVMEQSNIPENLAAGFEKCGL